MTFIALIVSPSFRLYEALSYLVRVLASYNNLATLNYFKGYYFSNISLNGNAEFRLRARYINIYDCHEVEAHWKIQRSDGETEMYTVLNETYHHGRDYDLPDRGLSFYGYCHPFIGCYLYVTISPTDMRYNGAQITGVFNLPECFNSSNITDPMTLNIQGNVFHALFSAA